MLVDKLQGTKVSIKEQQGIRPGGGGQGQVQRPK